MRRFPLVYILGTSLDSSPSLAALDVFHHQHAEEGLVNSHRPSRSVAPRIPWGVNSIVVPQVNIATTTLEENLVQCYFRSTYFDSSEMHGD